MLLPVALCGVISLLLWRCADLLLLSELAIGEYGSYCGETDRSNDNGRLSSKLIGKLETFMLLGKSCGFFRTEESDPSSGSWDHLSSFCLVAIGPSSFGALAAMEAVLRRNRSSMSLFGTTVTGNLCATICTNFVMRKMTSRRSRNSCVQPSFADPFLLGLSLWVPGGSWWLLIATLQGAELEWATKESESSTLFFRSGYTGSLLLLGCMSFCQRGGIKALNLLQLRIMASKNPTAYASCILLTRSVNFMLLSCGLLLICTNGSAAVFLWLLTPQASCVSDSGTIALFTASQRHSDFACHRFF